MNQTQLHPTARAASDHVLLRGAQWLWSCFMLSLFVLLVAACGGGGGGGDADGGSGSAVTPPVITVQPASVSSVIGAPAVFSVVADGNGIAYQWQRSVNNGLSWLDVAGASGAGYTVAAVDASMNGDQYRVVLQNIAGIVVSLPATLSATVPGGPAITTQPADVGVTAGATAGFTVTATGTLLSYQWQRSADGVTWADITGATTTRLDVAAVTLADSGAKVRVIVRNAAGSATSRTATLTVTAGGGGGGGGVPTDCVPANVLPVGMVVRATYALDTGGIAGTPWQADMTVVGPSTFQGRSVFETRIDTTGTFLPGVTRAFSTWDPTSRVLTPWGAIVRLEVGTTIADITSVARQPARYPVYALAVGQGATVTAVSDNTQVITVNGVAGAPQASTETTTTTYTFLGTETLTVPAGTFLTCKVRELEAGSAQPTTNWLMAGYGATVKSVSGTNTQLLTAISVNGAPLTRFP